MSTPSSGLKLEVAILAADQTAPVVDKTAPDEPVRLTVLVVADDADVRWYVRECLRDTKDVRVLEAANVSTALTLAAITPPQLLIVDVQQGDILSPLPKIHAVVIVDDVPRSSQLDGARVRFLARPFTAHQLCAEIDRLR